VTLVRALAVVNVVVTAVWGVTDPVYCKECVPDRDDSLNETEPVLVDSETESDDENVSSPIVAAVPVDCVRVACTDVRPDPVGAVCRDDVGCVRREILDERADADAVCVGAVEEADLECIERDPVVGRRDQEAEKDPEMNCEADALADKGLRVADADGADAEASGDGERETVLVVENVCVNSRVSVGPRIVITKLAVCPTASLTHCA
jgi:hypothetical protein